MKKLTFAGLFIFSIFALTAQTSKKYSLKAGYIHGNILKHTRHLDNLVKGPATGAEFAVEWQTMGEKHWHQYLNFPKTGLGAVYINLGNPDTLGNILAVYPYLNLPVLRTSFLNIHIKPGAGVSYLTKTFRDATAYLPSGEVNLNRSNAAIGSHINVYFAGSLNFEVPLGAGLSLTGDCGWNHVSNGSFIQPNSGVNMINVFTGLKYLPNHKNFAKHQRTSTPGLERKLTGEIILSGGARQLYYKDNRFFPTGSVVIAGFYPVTNFFRMGIGADLFYDGVFGEVNSSVNLAENETRYLRTYITQDIFKNKIRGGISLQNELVIGRLTAGMHVGMYLYNPIKNLEPFANAKSVSQDKPLIYKFDIEKEDGWMYTRASLKYALSKHYFISLGLKTHLQKAEFIEWGLGYRL